MTPFLYPFVSTGANGDFALDLGAGKGIYVNQIFIPAC
jgi:hypothetical protein